MKEYAFDAKLWAVVRVKAKSEKAARAAMEQVLDACDLSPAFLDGYNEAKKMRVVVTEASIGNDPSEAELFEIDGEYV